MNSAAVSNGATRMSLLFSPYHDSAPILAEVKNTLGLLSRWDGFVCDNVRRLLVYRAGVMVGAIDVEAVEVDIVDTDCE
jgi:hypothetical protein